MTVKRMNIVYGLLMIIVGVLMTLKSEWMLNNFGRIGWFEDKLGMEGGSRLAYKLGGMLMSFCGALVATDMLGSFVLWIVSPFFQLPGR